MDVLKYLRECRQDMIADGMEMDDSAAYDVAESLLSDPEFLKAAKKHWPGKAPCILREIVADCL
jgi:hypothetical protein